jgi:electron transfer flavoprotein alpha subunit
MGTDLLPRVAALAGVNQFSDVMEVVGPSSFRRPIYAGNAIIDVQAPAGQKIVMTVRTASWPAAGSGGNAAIEQRAPAGTAAGHSRYMALNSAGGERPDLQAATKVVSGGRALGSAEGFALIYRLADKLGAGVGASRAAVDAGYVPSDMQVGQTGKIISPDLYLAFGISGAIQHITGIKDSRTIVAINKDAEAPIFEIADIGLVGDLFTVIPEIEALLG